MPIDSLPSVLLYLSILKIPSKFELLRRMFPDVMPRGYRRITFRRFTGPNFSKFLPMIMPIVMLTSIVIVMDKRPLAAISE